jgi:hypothetical protein
MPRLSATRLRRLARSDVQVSVTPFALRNLVYAQVCFFAFLVCAALVSDKGVRDNHGLSYYGEHLNTIAPYGLGLALSSMFVWRAAAGATSPLGVCAARCRDFALLDLATPDTVDSVFYWAHVGVSAALFVLELAIAGGLVLVHPRARVAVLFAVQLAAGLLASSPSSTWVAYLSLGIVVYQAAFGSCSLSPRAILSPTSTRRWPLPDWAPRSYGDRLWTTCHAFVAGACLSRHARLATVVVWHRRPRLHGERRRWSRSSRSRSVRATGASPQSSSCSRASAASASSALRTRPEARRGGGP